MIQTGLNFLTTKRRKKKFQFLPKNGMRDKNHKNNLLLKENWHVSFEICQWILQSWNWIHFFWYIKNKILFHLYFYHFLAFKKFYRIPSCHCQYHWLRHYMKKAKWHIEIYNRGCRKVLILTKNGSKKQKSGVWSDFEKWTRPRTSQHHLIDIQIFTTTI